MGKGAGMSWWNFTRRVQTPAPDAEADRPLAGEDWILQGMGDPWPQKRECIARVLDVRAGWVRYSIGGVFNDERMKLETFTTIYSREPK